MYRCRIGMHQFIQLRCFIFYDMLVKVYFQRPFLQIYRLYCSNISVKNFFLIIISDLHDFIPGAKQISSPTQTVALWIQSFLKCKIQIRCSHNSFLHRCQHLNMIPGRFVITRKVVFYQPDNFLHRFLRIFFFYIEEIRIFAIGNIRKFAFIDGMRIHDDPAALCLSKNPGQTNHRKYTGINNVTQYISRPHRWELVDISHQYQTHPLRNCFEQRIHQYHVDHRTFINDQYISIQGIVLIFLISFRRFALQQTMDCLCL